MSGAVLGLLIGGLAGTQADKRSDRKAKRLVKFWKGRFGRWFFSVFGHGVRVERQVVALTNKPTELAIGTAVEQLFQALPPATRAAMEDLPAVVKGLEGDAQRMRARIDEYNDLLLHAGDDEHDRASARNDMLSGQRHRAAERVRQVRDQAQARLTETVAALERIRIDLLRLRAGAVELERVTTRLDAARDLAADVERLLAGQREVDGLLKEG